MLQLDQLTYRYFGQQEPQFQRKFSECPEFAELAMPEKVFPVPPKGNLFPHQKLAERFYNIYDFGTEYKEPGVGKTGGAYACAESFRKNYGVPVEQAYRNGTVNWIKQAVFLSPGDTAEESLVDQYHKFSDLKRPPEFYIFDHHASFYKRNSREGWNTLIKIYRNTFFFVDEVHRVINRSKEESTKEAKETKEMWNWYRRFFRIIPNIKVMLASGTLIIMKRNELGYILNLLPVVDMPLDEKWYDEVTEEELEEKIRGFISHVKNKQVNSEIIWPKDSVPLKDLVTVTIKSDDHVIPLYMSDYQSQQYKKIYDRRDPFNAAAINVSLIAIPEEYMARAKNGKKLSTPNKKFFSKIKDPVFLKDISIKQHRLKKDVNNAPGIVFVISDYKGNSVDISSRVLENEGYEEYIPGDNDENLPKEKRYAVIRAETPARNTQIIQFSKKYKNRHGEYLKVILSSRVGGEALSLHNVQTYIILDPSRNKSTELQRQARMFRPDSYDDLYNERISQGISHEDAIVKVMFYRYAAIPKLKGLPSVDINIHVANIEKDVPLQELRIMVDRIAYDGQIHRLRNQTDVKYGFFDPPAKKPTKSDYDRYNILYGHDKIRNLVRNLINTLTEQLSLNIDDFWNNNRNTVADISDIGFYRALSVIMSKGGKVLAGTGMYIYLRNLGDTLYIQSEEELKYKNYAQFPDTAIYSNYHAVLKLPLEMFISQSVYQFKNRKALRKWLDDNSVPISQKIEAIEGILAEGFEGANGPQYEYLIERYGGKTVFIMKKPIRRLQFLSSVPDAIVRSKVPIEKLKNIVSDEDVILHVLYAQYNENSNTHYGMFSVHTKVEKISLYDPYSKKFVKLEENSPEQLVYSDLIREKINKPYNKFVTKLNKRKSPYNKMYGLVYDPELKFRIVDSRKPVPNTKKGVPSKSKMTHGRTADSYGVENLIDFAIYLEITPPKEQLDVTTLDLTKHAVKKAKKAISEVAKLKTLVDSNPDQYSNNYNLVLLIRWNSLYTSAKYQNKSQKKDLLAKLIYDKLQDLDQIYYF